MRGESELIFLGAHGGVVPGNPIYHLHVTMFISSDHEMWNNSYFVYNSERSPLMNDTLRFATVSGGAPGPAPRFVISEFNRLDYMNRFDSRFQDEIHSGSGMVTAIFEAHTHFYDNYRTNFRYFALPEIHPGDRYNSTSITISLLNAVGLDHGMNWLRTNVQSAGIRSQIDPAYFGR